LDSGTSVTLAHKGEILIAAGRTLINVIVVYDSNIQQQWLEERFGVVSKKTIAP
jgi:hypothetical protein